MAREKNDNGPDPIDRHVGMRICQRRLALGYNQSDLARHLGLTFQQIQKYEKGSNRVSASKLWRTAQFLGCSVLDFFPQDGEALAAGDVPSGPLMDRRAHDLLTAFDGLEIDGKRAVIDVARAIAGSTAMRNAAAAAGVELPVAA